MAEPQGAVWRSTTALLAELPADVEADTYRAGLLHWFTPDLLDALRPAGNPVVMARRQLKAEDRTAAEVFEQLAHQPFVEEYPDRGLTLHDLTREAITTQLWEADETFVREVSARAAIRFEDKLQSAEGADADELVELAYHRLVADEDEGIGFVEWLWQVTQSSLSTRVLEGVLQAIEDHVAAGHLSEQVEAQSRLWRLWAAFAAQRYERACAIAQELADGPDTGADVREQARYFFAESLRTLGELDAAIVAFRTLETDLTAGAESRWLAMQAMGDINLERGQLEEAERLYAGALRLTLADQYDDDEAPDLDQLAALEPGRWQSAKDVFDLLGIDPETVLPTGDEPDEDDDSSDFEHLWAIEVDRLGSSAADQNGEEDEGGWQLITVTQSIGALWHRIGNLLYQQSAFDESAVALELAVRIFEELGEMDEAAQALSRLRVLAPRREGATSTEALDRQRSMLSRAEASGDRVAQVGVLLELASTYEGLSDNDRASESYQQAVAVAAEDENLVGEGSAHEALADLLIRTGRRNEADVHLDRAEQLYGRVGMRQGMADVQLSRGDLAMARNDPEQAAAAFRAAYDTYRGAGVLYGMVGALRGLGVVHLHYRDLDAATRALEEAAELAKRTTAQLRIDILSDLADVRHRLGDIESARGIRREASELVRAWDLRESEGNLLLADGQAEIDVRNLDAAEASYHSAAEVFADIGNIAGQVNAKLGLSRAAEARQKREAAVELARQAVELAPPDEPITGTALSQFALTLGEVGRFDEARSALSEAMRIDPDDPFAVGNMGYVLLRAGEYEESIEFSEQARELDDTQLWVVLNIGHALLALHRADEAEAVYRDAIAARRGDDDFKEDLDDIERLLAADPELPRGRELLALLSEAQSAVDNARPTAR